MGIGLGRVPPTTSVALSAYQHRERLITFGKAKLPQGHACRFPDEMLLSPMNCELARSVSSWTRVSRLYRPNDQSPDRAIERFPSRILNHGVVPIYL